MDGPTNAVTNVSQMSVEATDDGNRAPRLPRWTRQEILVLIQGKKVAENRVRRGRTAGSAFGPNQLEPKWVSVSSYCKRHGVNRGPVQCRKRWSNLAGDFKKIKEWESQIGGEADSFWVMRTDSRRERKLPGFFDREVYEMLDGGTVTETAGLTVTADGDEREEGMVPAPAPAAVVEEEEGETVFDSGRTAAADDGLFSDFEPSGQEEADGSPEKEGIAPAASPSVTVPAPYPVSEQHCETISGGDSDQGTMNEKHHASNPEKRSTYHEGQKRRRLSLDENQHTGLQEKLIKVLDRNSRMLMAQLEAQNINCELDRDQRKDQANSLVAVLGKLADAVGRIADKL